MGIIHPSTKDFDQLLQANEVVLVDFWATWCGPCLMLAPIIEEISKKYEGKAVVAKVDVDVERALAEHYQIMSIPTVLVFKKGELIGREIGAAAASVYETMIENAL